MSWMRWSPYVSVAQRRFNALREMAGLRKKGKDIQPVQIEGRTIARSFWGKGWCDHLESFSDYDNRLPRGRTYVRNGSVCHLEVRPGRIEAIVSGSELYNIRINIKKLNPATWKSVKKKCSGRIGSMLELLQGRLSDQVMTVVTDRKQGLFPQPAEIELHCDCPDWATMCKHVAAVLYGVGSRLDSKPDLLFLLRDVDAQELISAEMAVPSAVSSGDALDDDQLGDIFGIDLDVAGATQPARKKKPKKRKRAANFSSGGGTRKRRSADRRADSTMTKKESPRSPRRKPVPTAVQSKVSARASRDSAVRNKRIRATINNRAQGGNTGESPVPHKQNAAAPKIRPTGKSVAGLRKKLKLSATEFAKRLGVSAASVYRWEAVIGRLELRARPLAALAKLKQQTQRK